jgi:Ulp1 family protease
LAQLRSNAVSVVHHTGANLEFSAEDFKTLAPTGWLSDNCLNFYIALLQVRSP